MRAPLWTTPAIVVAVITVAVLIAGLSGNQETHRVVVTARALPAFHLVNRTDVKIAPLKSAAQNPDELSQVIGTVTKQSVPAGAPLGGTITGHTSRENLNGLVFIGFHATAVQRPDIEPGDDVVLGFAPVAAAVRARAGSIRALLIDDSIPKSGLASYVVAISRREAEWFLNLVGRSRMIVFKDHS